MSAQDNIWIFGYGSLVWRPAFEHLQRRPALLRGWKRRFWQASPDHRGTPQAPGRVVTLLREPGESCWGVAYEVAHEVAGPTLAALDYREKAGYERVFEPLYGPQGQRLVDQALVYVAGPTNPNFVGEAPLDHIAALVCERRGPSGSNVEYVLELARALEAMGAHDPHVSGLAQRVSALAQLPRGG